MDTFVSIVTLIIGLVIFFVLISKVNKVIRLLSQILNNIREIREPGSTTWNEYKAPPPPPPPTNRT